ncbi:MAG: dockerin type I repeat-containing protein [Oscillospiraceae bacterium]|nr:dockerin type I repeat-containing protein [Oscillospiraceae bacterium]
MYINTSNGSWEIPGYESANTDDGAVLGFSTKDLNIINYHGYLNGTGLSSVQEYIPVLSSKAIEANYSLRRILLNEDSWKIVTGGDDGIRMFSSFTSVNPSHDIKYAVSGNTEGCNMKLTQSEKIDMSMRYQNDRIRAAFGSAKEIVFDPSGYVEIFGNKSKYTLDFISNDGFAPTCWYQMTVSGEAGSVRMYKTDGGYILSADSLDNVSVSAKSDNANPAVTFSAEYEGVSYQKVFIYEIDEATIGIKVDTDKDGTFETTIAQSSGVVLGDVDGNGAIELDDAQLALAAYTNQLAHKPSGLNTTQEQAADVTGDGDVTVDDAQAILQYYTETLAHKNPTWDKILHP